MRVRKTHPVIPYLVAVLATAVVAFSRWSLEFALHGHVPFLLFTLAVLAAAYVGGLKPGLFATALSILVGTALFISPASLPIVIGQVDMVRISLFALVGVCLSLTCEGLLRAQHSASGSFGALAAAEQQFRSTFENAAVGISHVALSGHFLRTNRTLCELLGRDPSALEGRTIEEFTHPDDLTRETELFQELLEGRRESYSLEKRYLRADGSELWSFTTRSLQRDAAGIPLYSITVVQDINELKRVQCALEDSQDRLRLAVDAAKLGIWDVHLPSGECVFDDQALHLIGSAKDSLRLEDLDTLLHPDDRVRAIDGVRQATLPSSSGRFEDEFRVIWPRDGSSHWLLALGQVYFEGAGTDRRPVRLLGTARDITERRGAEEELRRSEERFRTLADNIAQLAWIAEPSGEVVWVNRRWLEFTGLSVEESRGWGWQRAHHPDQLAGILERLRYAIEHGEVWEEVFSLRSSDGSYRSFLSRSVPVAGSDGRVQRWLGTSTDITEQLELIREREQLLESERAARIEAERANRIKDQFLATVSHELRTPLNAILGWSKLLRRNHAEVGKAVPIIEENAKVQAQLIEDLLDMSRVISGRLRIETQHVTVNEFVNAAVEAVRPSAEERGITLDLELDTTLCCVEGEFRRLQQVVWNLLTNAVKFTPSGGKVYIRAYGKEGRVQIVVRDTGEGISPEFLPFLFDRFRQADSSTTRRHRGLGLGLAISKHIAELHGGTIRAESAGAGKGATFTVVLPLARKKVETTNGRPAAENISSDEYQLPDGLRILVVDDEPDVVELMRHVFRQSGAEVLTANSAHEALRLLEREREVKVLVSDIGMPEMDGYELIRSIRSMPDQRAGIPAVALTAFARAQDKARALEAGFMEHITKPIDPIEVVRVVGRIAKQQPEWGEVPA